MAGASNLLQFKRGTQDALNTLRNRKEGIDGCFYLTVDTASDNSTTASKLYVGRADGSIVPVNQGIVNISNLETLKDATLNHSFTAGDFAYVGQDNILAVYNGTKWVQINQYNDEYLNNLNTNASNITGGAKVETVGNMKSGSGARKTSFNVKGARGITVTGSGSTTPESAGAELTITGTTYELGSGDLNNNAVPINLTANGSTAAGTVTLKGVANGNITLGKDGNDITINSKDTKLQSVSVNNATSGNGFVISVQDDSGAKPKSDTLNPVIAYGNAETPPAYFLNGTATLSVYSKAEIDAKFRNEINPMVYKGVVGDVTGAFASNISNLASSTTLSVGDTFKIVSSGMSLSSTLSGGTSDIPLRVGDIIIANGQEDSSTGYIINTGSNKTLKFDYVPSGDDVDTTYALNGDTEHGVAVKSNVSGTNIFKYRLIAGTAISMTDGGTGTEKTVTINHANVTHTTGTDDAVSNYSDGTLTTSFVSGVTVNDQGHVTAVNTKQVKIKDLGHAVSGLTVSTAVDSTDTKKINITENVTVKNPYNNTPVSTTAATFSLRSENLALSVSGTTITANYVWGTF